MQKRYLLAISLFVLIFLRFININSIPIFGDEALYLHIADEFRKNPINAIPYSISYGVFPVYSIVIALIQLITFDLINPLILGRAVAILIDILSAFVVFKITKKIFDTKAAILAGTVYLLLPLTFFHSRLVMLESLANFLSLLGLLFATNLVYEKRLNLKDAIFAAIVLALSFFTKPLGALIFPTIIALPLLRVTRIKSFVKELWIPTLNLLLVFAIFLIFITLLYIPISNEFTVRYVNDGNKNILDTVAHFKLNLFKLWWWTKVYITLPLIITSILPLFLIFHGVTKKILWVYLWIISIIVLETLFSARYFPRHIYILSAPIAILSGLFFSYLSERGKVLTLLAFILVLVPSIDFDTKILFSPQASNIALEDKQQFYEDWTSGTGLPQMANKINELSRHSDIVVFTEKDPSFTWTLTELYGAKDVFKESDNLRLGLYLTENDLDTDKKVYLLLNKKYLAPEVWPLELVYSYPKGPNRAINLYQLKHN